MTLINEPIALQFNYRWAPVNRINKVKVPKTLWPWLVTQASLTAKLEATGVLSVDVIEDAWGTPTVRERNRLKLRPRDAARIRTVLLKIDGVTVIYARSIIPAKSLRGHWRQVKYLKNKPLGGYLFKHRALIRSNVEITQLPKQMFPNQSNTVWARRSVFQQFGSGILVSEAFLDNINHLKSPFGLS